MTAPATPAGRAGRDTELLRQLGLPPSAGPEDLDSLHAAVSEYLAAAPGPIHGWAHAQAAALDAAYLQLTDPAGLEGSTLMGPSSQPAVAPGEPATPPARRDTPAPAPAPAAPDPAAAHGAAKAAVSKPAASKPAAAKPSADGDRLDEDELDDLYASVTPSAHRDMRADAGHARSSKTAPAAAADPAAATRRGFLAGPWKKVAVGALTVAAVAAIAFTGYTLGGGGTPQVPAASADTGLTLNEEKVAQLMQKLQADPRDTATLLSLADEYYQAQQYAASGDWLDKLLAIDPKDINALLARGAVSFNLGDLPTAEATWKRVVSLDPKNIEAHYDLGFLYLNQTPADMAAVKDEWTQVVTLGPGTQLAQTVQSHLDSFAAASMLPASAAPGAAGASPAASPAASPSPAPATSALPSGSAGTQP
jgi:tetratricopeptide (TPR) repeat protein